MKILVLAGDGIGPEISQATLTVLERANALYKLGLEWQHDEIGFVTLKKEGTTLPPRVMDAARAAAGVLLGLLRRPQYAHGYRRVHADRGHGDGGTPRHRQVLRAHCAARL